MNTTLIEKNEENGMSKGLYIGFLIGGPIVLTVLVIILFVVLRLYIQSRQQQQQQQQQRDDNNEEIFEMGIEGEDVTSPEIRTRNNTNENNIADSQNLTLDSWLIHQWIPYIHDGDYVDMRNIFVRVSVDTYLLN